MIRDCRLKRSREDRAYTLHAIQAKVRQMKRTIKNCSKSWKASTTELHISHVCSLYRFREKKRLLMKALEPVKLYMNRTEIKASATTLCLKRLKEFTSARLLPKKKGKSVIEGKHSKN